MDINELITIVKNKLLNQINIESINVEDKSFLHKNHNGNQVFPCSATGRLSRHRHNNSIHANSILSVATLSIV